MFFRCIIVFLIVYTFKPVYSSDLLKTRILEYNKLIDESVEIDSSSLIKAYNHYYTDYTHKSSRIIKSRTKNHTEFLILLSLTVVFSFVMH